MQATKHPLMHRACSLLIWRRYGDSSLGITQIITSRPMETQFESLDYQVWQCIPQQSNSLTWIAWTAIGAVACSLEAQLTSHGCFNCIPTTDGSIMNLSMFGPPNLQFPPSTLFWQMKVNAPQQARTWSSFLEHEPNPARSLDRIHHRNQPL